MAAFDGASEPPANLKAVALLAGGHIGARFTKVLLLVCLVSVLRQWVTSELSADDARQLIDAAGFNDRISQPFLRLLQVATPILASLPLTGRRVFRDGHVLDSGNRKSPFRQELRIVVRQEEKGGTDGPPRLGSCRGPDRCDGSGCWPIVRTI